MDVTEQLRTLANEAAIRSIPKLLKTAAGEGIKATKKQAEDALKERVPAQVLAPQAQHSEPRERPSASHQKVGTRSISSISRKTRRNQGISS